MDIREIRDLLDLDLLDSRSVPALATELLAAGWDGERLVRLAGLSSGAPADMLSAFREALAEIGFTAVAKSDALARLARAVSCQILDGTMAPLAGAELLWRAALRVGGDYRHEVDGFIYAASEMPGRPVDRQLFEDAIRAEARRWCV